VSLLYKKILSTATGWEDWLLEGIIIFHSTRLFLSLQKEG